MAAEHPLQLLIGRVISRGENECDTLQNAATHCNTLQKASTKHNTLQHAGGQRVGGGKGEMDKKRVPLNLCELSTLSNS